MYSYSMRRAAYLRLDEHTYVSIDHIVSVTADPDDEEASLIIMTNSDVHHAKAKVSTIMDKILNKE